MLMDNYNSYRDKELDEEMKSPISIDIKIFNSKAQ